MKQRKFMRPILVVLLTLNMVLIITGIYGWDLYTKAWHILHSEPLRWNDLVIDVPHSLIAKWVGKDDRNEQLFIYGAGDAPGGSILLSIYSPTLQNETDLIAVYYAIDRRIITTEHIEVLGIPSIRVSSINNENGRYSEDVFLQSINVRVSFTGDINNKFYLAQVLSGLKRVQER